MTGHVPTHNISEPMKFVQCWPMTLWPLDRCQLCIWCSRRLSRWSYFDAKIVIIIIVVVIIITIIIILLQCQRRECTGSDTTERKRKRDSVGHSSQQWIHPSRRRTAYTWISAAAAASSLWCRSYANSSCRYYSRDCVFIYKILSAHVEVFNHFNTIIGVAIYGAPTGARVNLKFLHFSSTLAPP